MVINMWARIENGTVAEITDIDPAGRFHPSLQWVECGIDVEQGWGYDGEAFKGPPKPEVDNLPVIAARRYEAETSGTTVDGMPVNTERDSQALLTGAALQAMLDPNYTVRWKTEGGFVDLDAQQIIGLASAVRAHVQACFDREAELVAAVEDGSYTESMLGEGWP